MGAAEICIYFFIYLSVFMHLKHRNGIGLKAENRCFIFSGQRNVDWTLKGSLPHLSCLFGWKNGQRIEILPSVSTVKSPAVFLRRSCTCLVSRNEGVDGKFQPTNNGNRVFEGVTSYMASMSVFMDSGAARCL